MPKKLRQRPTAQKKVTAKKKVPSKVKTSVKKGVRQKPVKKSPVKKSAPKKAAVGRQPAKTVKKAKTARTPAKPSDLSWRESLPGEIFVGVAEDYLSHLGVMLITVKVPVAVGDTLHVRGFTSDFKEKVESVQLEHQPVNEAMAGQDVGIKISDKVRKHDYIYKVLPV